MAESHVDGDSRMAEEILASLKQRAGQATATGTNRITAGIPGEAEVASEQVGMFWLRQMPDDPDALRISIGEGNKIADSAYFVFRGDPQHVVELLDRAVAAMKASHFRC